MKKKPRKKQHPEWGRGYRSGLKRERERSRTIIQSLNNQLEYWRGRYIQMRDAQGIKADLFDPDFGHVRAAEKGRQG